MATAVITDILKKSAIIKEDGSINSNWKKLVTPQIKKLLNGRTPAEVAWIDQNGQPEGCAICGQSTIFARGTFRKFCSARCSANAETTQYARKQSNIKKYGIDYPQKLEVTKHKAAATVLQKYGSTPEHYFGGSYFKKVMLKKYGVENAFNLGKLRDQSQEIKSQAFTRRLSFLLEKENLSLVENPTSSQEVKLQHICGHIFSRRVWCSQIPRCKKCFPHQISTQHIRVKTWLLENNINFVENDRKIIKPRELDFYLPEHNLAIEINGLYWHSEAAGAYNGYHQEKLISCLRKSITLISLFEDEIDIMPNEVKDRLFENYINISKDEQLLLDGKCLKVSGAWPLPQQFNLNIIGFDEPKEYKIHPQFKHGLKSPVWDCGEIFYVEK